MQRIAELIKREISKIMYSSAEDQRLKRLIITHVNVTPDLKLARIYVSNPNEKEQTEEYFHALQKASGFIKSNLAPHLQLRYMPELEFIYDTSLEKACQVIELLNQIEKKDER